jgi:tryptophan synthase beta chain
MRLGRELGARAGGGRGGEPPLLLVNLSGRGDKDVETASRWFGLGDRTEVDPGPGMDTDQQPTEGAVSSGDAVAGQDAGSQS